MLDDVWMSNDIEGAVWSVHAATSHGIVTCVEDNKEDVRWIKAPGGTRAQLSDGGRHMTNV